MKIDFYISSLSGGGAEKVLTTLAENFAKRGNDVSITSLEKRPQFYPVSDSVTLNKVNNMNKGKIREMLGDFVGVRKWMKKQNADISISFLSRCNILVILASLFTNKKIVVCDRNNPLMEHSEKVFKRSCRLYKHANAVFVQTEKIKSFYPQSLQKKIFVIENPIDFDALKGQIGDENIEKSDTIISLGRLEKQKDFTTLIKAFSKVSPKHPSWDLKIYGTGDMIEELIALTNTLGVNDKVIFCNRTEKPFLELSKSKIFVLSSNYEGFPNALCEAMASGIACISSDCISGPSELITNGDNGYLFPVGDVDALAKQLESVIDDEDKRKQLGDNASKAVAHLELNAIVDKWLNTITSL